MKTQNIKTFFLNALLYGAIAIVLYLLYSPLNDDPANKTSSSIQFVYQQF